MAGNEVPIWALPTADQAEPIPPAVLMGAEEGFTPERLERLRRVLAVYADNPPVLLERHAVAVEEVPAGGRVLVSTSPLLKTLHDVVGTTTRVTASERAAGATGVLYRMIVPKEIAGDLASGLARSMPATGPEGGIHGAILGKAGIVAHAKFAPVLAAGGGTGAAATATTAATIGGAVIAAAPFVILLAATAASIYAEAERRRALERLQVALEAIKREALEQERDQLNGTVGAISKATAILADDGRLGLSLGLDAAAHAIDTAVSTAERRLAGWEKALAALNSSATSSELEGVFKGIGSDGGEFTTELRMAVFAIATKRRLAVLQAAEHTQLNPGLSLARFARTLQKDLDEMTHLEDRITVLLKGISALALRLPDRWHDIFYTPNEVKSLLAWGPRLQRIAATETPGATVSGDVEISLVIPSSGHVRVLEPVRRGPEALHG